MKNIRITTTLIATAIIILSVVSCQKDFYTKANKNPNAPSYLLPNVLLPPIEVSIAYAQGGDMSRFASMFTQQTAGLSRQSQAYYEYVFTNQDPENLWDNMYTAVMENDYNLMQVCASGSYNAYKGIAEALMAYSLQITVDCWGSVPYSQAFKGSNNLTPTYDKDVTLYSSAMTLCSNAISDLNNTTNDLLLPGSDDVVYSGNLTRWIEFAHAVKARLYVHQASQSGGGNKTMADSAIAEVGRSFASNADNAEVFFGSATTANAPWNQFWNQRGDIYFFYGTQADGQSYFYDLLVDTLGRDPRFPILIDTLQEFTPPYSLNSYYQLATSPVEFICYDELQFLLADAILTSTGNIATAQLAYQNGITANMNKLSSNPAVGTISPAQIAAYILAHGTLPANVNDAHARVDLQEYIALYLNPEAWTVWRRSTYIPGYANGYPLLLPIAGPFQSNGIPHRLIYPQTELNLNGANVPNASLWSPKVFWDN